MKLKIHLRHGLLHMLDMRGCGVQQAFALAQIGPQLHNLALRTKAGAQQAIRVKPLQPLRIAHVRLATGNMLGVTCIDQNYLKAALVEQFKNRDPVDAGRFHDDRLDPAFRKPISQPVQISSESPKTANRVGCAVSAHRRHMHGCTDIDGCCVWIDHRKPGVRCLRFCLALHFDPPAYKSGRAGLRS